MSFSTPKDTRVALIPQRGFDIYTTSMAMLAIMGVLFLWRARVDLSFGPAMASFYLVTGFFMVGVALSRLLPGMNYLEIGPEAFVTQYGLIRRRTRWADCVSFETATRFGGRFVGVVLRDEARKRGLGARVMARINGSDMKVLPALYGMKAEGLAATMTRMHRQAMRGADPVAPAETALIVSAQARRGRWWASVGLIVASLVAVDFATARAAPDPDSPCWTRSDGAAMRACTGIIERGGMLQRASTAHNLAMAHVNRGRLLMKRKAGYSAAASDFARALEIDPTHPKARARLGAILFKLDKPEPAIELLTLELAHWPDDVYALHMRARAHVAMGNREAALADYERTFSLGGRERVDSIQTWLVRRNYISGASGRYDDVTRDALIACIADKDC